VFQQPSFEALAVYLAGCEIEHQPFLLVHVCGELVAIQEQKHLHGCMRDSLVAIVKREIQRERTTKCSGLGGDTGVQVGTPKEARGWARADSRAARSRTPEAPPDVSTIARCSATTSPSVGWLTRGRTEGGRVERLISDTSRYPP
jgi:hypothetical protein